MIIGFWHVAQIGCWERIYPQQWTKLKDSGLYAASDKIYVHLVGNEDPDRGQTEFNEWIIKDPKVIFKSTGTRYVFEYPTLAMTREIALQTPEPFYAYYIHTKGASTANHFIQNGAYWWGQYLEHYTIIRWKDNVQKLNEGYEATGVEWRGVPMLHFSGNFWWATSDYLKRLPDGHKWWEDHKHDRIMAEMYIGQAKPKIFCFKNTQQNLYLYNCTPDQWA